MASIPTWNVWLLNRGHDPLLYYGKLPERELNQAILHAKDKVLDGSDADAFLFTRSDNYNAPLSGLLSGPRKGTPNVG